MKYNIVLTERGKEIFKGGNTKPMSKMLISFQAKNRWKAEVYFDKRLRETLGSASENLFEVEEKKIIGAD